MACNSCSGGKSQASGLKSGNNGGAGKKSGACACQSNPNPFIPSYETQEKLAQCLKQVACDVLRCLGGATKTYFENNQSQSPFVECLETAVVSFTECVPDALCGPVVSPPATNELPCDFAVDDEIALSVNAPAA